MLRFSINDPAQRGALGAAAQGSAKPRARTPRVRVQRNLASGAFAPAPVRGVQSTPTPGFAAAAPSSIAPAAAANPLHVMTFPDVTMPLPDARTVATSGQNVANAARTGDVKMLQYHLAASPGDIVNMRLDHRRTTLLLLTTRFAPSHDPDYPEFNANRAVAYLLRMRANPNAADSQGFTPLYEIAKRGPAYFDALLALLAAGARTSVRNADGVTVMHVALRRYSRDPARVLQALIAAHADVNEKSQGGITPLFVAARYCDDPTQAIDILLRAKADPNLNSGFEVPGEEGGTQRLVGFGSPLVALANYSPNPLPAMRLLVAAGADVRKARQQYVNVYAHGDSPIREPNEVEALFRALRQANEPLPPQQIAPSELRAVAQQLRGMEEHTVWTAAAAGREDIVAYYIKQRPHLFGYVSDKRHKGPSTYVLAHAVVGKQTQIVRMLLEELPRLRAELENPGPGFDINAVDGKNMTALLHGIRSDSQREVQLLLLGGADPTLRGPLKPRKWYNAFNKGQAWENALMFAIDTGRLSCARSILEWYKRNPQEHFNLAKVEKAAKASPNNMMSDCFNQFQRQRTRVSVGRDS